MPSVIAIKIMPHGVAVTQIPISVTSLSKLVRIGQVRTWAHQVCGVGDSSLCQSSSVAGFASNAGVPVGIVIQGCLLRTQI